MKRREVITFLCGLAVAGPLAARAQGKMRRIGVVMVFGEDDPEGQVRLKTFLQGLKVRGLVEGSNLHVDTCWGEGNAERFRSCAAELVGRAPDVILAGSGAAMPALMEATHSIPIVFVQLIDPVGLGYVASLAKPDSNATGFIEFEYGTAGKWLEVLKQVAPQLTRVAVLREVNNDGIAQFAAIRAAAPAFGVELTPIGVRDPSEIERGINAFAAQPGGGLVVTANASTAVHRDLIIALVARHRLPAVYPFRYFASDGGLISYGINPREPFQRAAEYVDRILNGEKPGSLPVQAATKFELIVNLKTAKALGIDVPPALLARADEVIE